MVELPFRADRTRPEPVFQQLAERLRELIETGRLAPGAKLPASRELAATLGLSRATVTRAFESLLADGRLTAHVGQGTFVPRDPAKPSIAGPSPARSFVWPGLFSQRARLLALPSGLESPLGDVRFDFRGGQVDAESLPLSPLRLALSRVLARRGTDLAGHVDLFGWAPLRREVARLLVGRGLVCTPEEVLIVDGSQQALDLAARVLIDPGDAVAIEQPGYFGATMAFTAYQATLIGVSVDRDGIRTDELERILEARRVKLLYVTPATQCPTGAVLSDSRRREILALADRHQVPVFEDDYDCDLRYAGPPVAALKSEDRAGQVLYAGTFSKILFPTLRVGYVVAAAPLLRRLALAKLAADAGGNLLVQAALARLLEGGGLDRHLRQVRRVYAERLQVMRASLARHMPPGARWSEPRGGHVLWLELPAGVDGRALQQASLDAGIAYARGDAFFVDGRGADCVSLSFATMPPARIASGVRELASLVRERLRGRRAPRRVRASAPSRGLGGRRAAS